MVWFTCCDSEVVEASVSGMNMLTDRLGMMVVWTLAAAGFQDVTATQGVDPRWIVSYLAHCNQSGGLRDV